MWDSYVNLLQEPQTYTIPCSVPAWIVYPRKVNVVPGALPLPRPETLPYSLIFNHLIEISKYLNQILLLQKKKLCLYFRRLLRANYRC